MDLAELALAFGLGLTSAASPCLLPLYPAFIAYLSGNSRAIAGRPAAGFLGLVVLLGVLTAMIAVAVVLTAFSRSISSILAYVIPIVDGILIALGILLVAGRNPFARLPAATVPVLRDPFRQAFAYGLLLGPLALPCAGPFLATLLLISIDAADALQGLLLFVVFGLGFGLPLVLLSFVAMARGQALVRWIVARHRQVEVVSGFVLIGAGMLDLTVNWDQVRLAFGI
jgi:cytochrome c-type biogenesis protein